jgi:hypothetical protein
LINSNLGFPAEKSEIMAAENVDVTGNTTISSALWAFNMHPHGGCKNPGKGVKKWSETTSFGSRVRTQKVSIAPCEGSNWGCSNSELFG